MKSAFALTLCLAVFSIDCWAQERYTFGTGERYDTVHQPWHPCGTDPDATAQGICSVSMPDGTTRRFGYQVDRLGTHAGNRCGYSTYAALCYGMPEIADNRERRFVVGETAEFGCGTAPDQVARNYCTIKGPNPTAYPFTLRRTSTTDGHRCGYSEYEVKCRRPFPPGAAANTR